MHKISTSLSLVAGGLLIAVVLFFHLRDSHAGNSGHDLVEVVTLDESETLIVDLPYATKKNFTGVKLYPVERCFLRRRVAERLIEVHRELADKGLGLKIWDGYRPHRVQFIMWRKSPTPGYVGNPKYGSRHNRGAAVDVTLVDLETGEELAMATPYDEFSKKAGAYYRHLPAEIKRNRKTLQDAMTRHGFRIMSTEWWHFDAVDWREFPLADIPIEDLVESEKGE